MDNPIEIWPEQLYREPWFRPPPWMGLKPFYILEPEAIGRLLLDDADKFPKDWLQERILKPAFGEGLLTAQGAQWRWQRRAAAPAFRHEAIMGMVSQISAAAETWVAAAGDGARLDVAQATTDITYDVILQTMLSGGEGLGETTIRQDIERYLHTLGKPTLGDVLRWPEWTRRLMAPGGGEAAARLRASVGRMVAHRRRRAAEGALRRGDLVDLLFEAIDPEDGRRMTDGEMVDNLLTFIGAGHETTAVSLAWTLYLVANHPPTAARLDAEIAEVLDGGGVTAGNLGRLVFTRQVVQEAMRLYPPIPIMTRMCVEPTTLCGQAVEPGTLAVVPIYALHRHAALWRAPEAFDPDRFAPEAVKARPRYAYLPFGAGPRTCIAASFAMVEAVTILATLLRDLRFEADPRHPVRALMRISLRPQGGLPMRVFRR